MFILPIAGIAIGAGYLLRGLSYPMQYVPDIADSQKERAPSWPLLLDSAQYDKRLLAIANVPEMVATTTIVNGTTTVHLIPNPALVYGTNTNVTVKDRGWPAAAPYPHGGAILPFRRVVAYYGNFYSSRMGILGELPREQVLTQLRNTAASWEIADPKTPVLPAIHYIAMVAQRSAGEDGMYRSVMPHEHIERAYDMARDIQGILFLDLQVGKSTLERELPQFRKYLARPDVHLAIDPEFSMKRGNPPGSVIGSYDAEDINFAIDWLAEIVREYKLPPKILVVHRFTQAMVANYQEIRPRPEVQVVIHMDGWGPKELKRNTYRLVVELEPVQFAGLKIFYKNDLRPPSDGIFTPEEALKLHPRPIYIQYQ